MKIKQILNNSQIEGVNRYDGHLTSNPYRCLKKGKYKKGYLLLNLEIVLFREIARFKKKIVMTCEISDIDWQFGVVAASSEETLVGKTFVQIKLTVNNGAKVERLNLELSVQQFYSLLHDLEKARTKMEYT